MADFVNFPVQTLSYKAKNTAWRKNCVKWASNKTYFNLALVRNSVNHKMINYNLLNGKLSMSDLALILNPEHLEAGFVPEKIQHYPIMNGKLNLIKGEEKSRIFDYQVIITNPNSISQIAENKKNQVLQQLQQLMQDQSQSEDEFQQNLQKISDYFTYSWQDMRELRANQLLKHYTKELNLPLLFNHGIIDAMAVGEEIYQVDIVGGEPYVEKLDPTKVRVYKSGYSNKIEDADIIIIEDYWSPGKIIDTYYDVLTKKDIDYIEKTPNNIDASSKDSMDNIDERLGFINRSFVGEDGTDTLNLFTDTFSPYNSSLMPYDLAGNLRVLRVYWKSRRKIKKIKRYDENGEEEFDFYPEDYIANSDLGEEEESLWINEAWEGTMIGSDIFVNMRPRPVQYNRISNPSKCHFGIIGSIYNIGSDKPYSMVDMMKPYNYLYDIIHDRLNKLIAKNWGKIITLDLAKVPKDWSIEKWMYYAKTSGIAVTDSFKEGNTGAATGKIAGALNNASSGVIDAEWGNTIQYFISLLEYVKSEMSDIVGITKQREGQVSNRETVGGVERATLQSSHITEWIFTIHDDIKKRVLECLIETAKIALRGQSKKFEYLLSDGSKQIMDIDGDEFAECDYGLVVDNSDGTLKLSQQIETLAQAALQTQVLSFSTIMKLYSSCSIAEKRRIVENDERQKLEQAQQQQQQQLEAQQQAQQQELEFKQQELKQKEDANVRDNETRIEVAKIQAQSYANFGKAMADQNNDANAKAKLNEDKRQFNAKMDLERDKLKMQEEKNRKDADLKSQQIQVQKTKANSNK